MRLCRRLLEACGRRCLLIFSTDRRKAMNVHVVDTASSTGMLVRSNLTRIKAKHEAGNEWNDYLPR